MKKFSLFLLMLSLALAVNLSVAPSNYHLDMDPDSNLRRTFTVTNKGDEEISVRVYLNDWDLKGGEKVFLPAGNTPYTLMDAVSFYPSLINLKAGETKQVMMNVKATKTDTAGEYGVLFFEARPVAEPKGSGLSFGGRIGSILYKEIPERSLVKYKVADIGANLVGNKLYYRFNILNEGNILLRPTLTLMVLDQANSVVVKKNVSSLLALPGKLRTESDSIILSDYGLKSKALTLIMTLDFGNDNVFMEEIKVK